MVKRLILVLSFLLYFSACSGLRTSKDSLQSDQYWAQMVKNSEENGESILSVVKKRNASLHSQIINDSKDSKVLAFWGQSLNFDSGAKKQIISDEITMSLHAQFGLNKSSKNENTIVHAGIAHTYGYLFSVLDTPFGFKRKRWILPTLNFGFSLDGKSLSPETREGGLLSNVTYFAGMLSFKNEKDRAALQNLKNVSNEIRQFDYQSLKNIEYLEEEFSTFSMRTTLIPLPRKLDDEQNDYLLIYSLLDRGLSREFLITIFPIKTDAYSKITSAEFLGSNMPIMIRYNAYLDGMMNKKLNGVRRLLRQVP